MIAQEKRRTAEYADERLTPREQFQRITLLQRMDPGPRPLADRGFSEVRALGLACTADLSASFGCSPTHGRIAAPADLSHRIR
jgi:hypothetical protein